MLFDEDSRLVAVRNCFLQQMARLFDLQEEGHWILAGDFEAEVGDQARPAGAHEDTRRILATSGRILSQASGISPSCDQHNATFSKCTPCTRKKRRAGMASRVDQIQYDIASCPEFQGTDRKGWKELVVQAARLSDDQRANHMDCHILMSLHGLLTSAPANRLIKVGWLNTDGVFSNLELI